MHQRRQSFWRRAEAAEKALRHARADVLRERDHARHERDETVQELAEVRDQLELQQRELATEKELHSTLVATTAAVEAELAHNFHDAEASFEAQRRQAESMVMDFGEGPHILPQLHKNCQMPRAWQLPLDDFR